jgi:hypothetical protein
MIPNLIVILISAGALVIGAFYVGWLRTLIAAQRRTLAHNQVTLRLYRETRNDSDAQIRDLLDQNTRLARQLIDAKIGTTTSAVPVSTWPVMARES